MTPRNALTPVLAVAALSLAACQDGPGPVGPDGLDPAFSVAAQGADGPDRHALARAIPGFGGLFFENGQPTVALVDPAMRPQAERVLAAFLRDHGFSESQLRVRPAAFGYEDIDAWYAAFWAEAFAEGGVVLADLNETRNAIVIGVEDGSRTPGIRAVAARLGIPAAAVIVEEVEPIVPLATLRDVASSITGGLQIHFGNYLCTLGFNALSGSEESFITNSHCTNVQGGTEGTQYYQPLSSLDPTVVGLEVDDPDYFRDGVCPRGARCRYSDAARIRQQSSRSFSRGVIAKTTGVNNGSLVINGSFTITGEAGSGCPVEGSTINKVGRTTGWTAGPIVNSCVNVGVSGSNIVQLRQVIVQAGVGSGDSGSPAFRVTSGSNVTLHGILWGGGSSTFVYSPLANIESELGDLTVTAGGGGSGGSGGSDGTMHVADLDGSANVKGRSGKWEALVTVRIEDGNGNPVANANVTVSLSGAATGQVSGATDSTGAVTLGTGNLSDGTSVTFTVVNVTGSASYDSGANADPDGDSNGTTITVTR